MKEQFHRNFYGLSRNRNLHFRQTKTRYRGGNCGRFADSTLISNHNVISSRQTCLCRSSWWRSRSFLWRWQRKSRKLGNEFSMFRRSVGQFEGFHRNASSCPELVSRLHRSNRHCSESARSAEHLVKDAYKSERISTENAANKLNFQIRWQQVCLYRVLLSGYLNVTTSSLVLFQRFA